MIHIFYSNTLDFGIPRQKKSYYNWKKPEQYIPITITVKPILYRMMISKFIWIDWKSSIYSYGAFWVKFFSVS